MPSALDQLATVRSRSAPVPGGDGFQDSVHFRVQVWGRVRERAGIDDEDLPRNIDTVALQVESPDEVAFTGALVHTSACFRAPAPQLALSTPRQVELRRHRQGHG